MGPCYNLSVFKNNTGWISYNQKRSMIADFYVRQLNNHDKEELWFQ